MPRPTRTIVVTASAWFFGARPAMRIRMAWEKLKREAAEGDEIWAFENPANTHKKLGRHTGYALVRKGRIVKSVVVTSN